MINYIVYYSSKMKCNFSALSGVIANSLSLSLYTFPGLESLTKFFKDILLLVFFFLNNTPGFGLKIRTFIKTNKKYKYVQLTIFLFLIYIHSYSLETGSYSFFQ